MCSQIVGVGQGIASLTGGEMESLLQVLEVCLKGLIQKEEFKCWTLHIDIVYLLCDTKEWSNELLQQLTTGVTHGSRARLCQ